MLTRAGSPPGPAWMRRFSESLSGPKKPTQVPEELPPEQKRRMRWFWILFVAMMMFLTLVRPLPGPSNPPQSYESPIRVAGLPLFASGQHPRGIIAYGSFPVGVIAIGGLSVGLIAIGGVALGGIALSGLSFGLLALGGGAFGYYAFGGLAAGAYAYAGGGVAVGYHEACGRQKERLFG